MEVEIPVPEGDGKIPPLTPLTNQEEEAPEIKPFKISFDDKYYKGSECQAHGTLSDVGRPKTFFDCFCLLFKRLLESSFLVELDFVG